MAPSDSFAEAFEPTSLRMIVPADPGGGTDSMARITGRFMAQYLPGRPSFVYVNDPGASGIKALNEFTKRTKPDGITTIAGSSSNIDPTTLRNPAVLYKANELLMVGGLPAPSGVMLLRKSVNERLHDKSLPSPTMGDVSAVRTSGQMGVWGPAFLGWNLKWVLGYKGSSEVMLALLRGEIDSHATFDREIILKVMESGDFIMPVQTGVIGPSGKLVPGMHYPDIPVFSDLIIPQLKTEREKSAYAAWELLVQGGKWFALPPGTPTDIVAVYRKAFDLAAKDPAFIDATVKILGDDFTVASGEDMQRIAVKTDLITDSDVKFFDEIREKVGLRTVTKQN
jgi:hypothetical protein